LAVAGRGDWFDVISLAATEAREHAEKTAITDVGPAAVEQFTADVVRLARAYVSAPAFPLFAAMRRLLAQIQAAIERRIYPAQADLRSRSWPRGGTPCFGGCYRCHDQRGDPVGPPPAERVVCDQGCEREQAGCRSDAA
jgi:hypothetical protein